MGEVYLGIDWGGTRVKLATVSPDGVFLRHTAYPTARNAPIQESVEALVGQARALLASTPGRLRGIGLGLTGPVDPQCGVVYLPGKVKGLEGYPLVEHLADCFGVPVTADNDGTVALFAERHYGKARGVDWASVLTIGTGVGSGVLIDGKIIADPHFMFGTQIGHLVIKSGDEPLCLTGARGTGEMYCSATALALEVRNALARGIPSTLSERYFINADNVDFRAVIEEGVALGDRLCLDALRRWATNLSWLIVNAIHAYSSQIVILSGGATLGAGYYLPYVQRHVDTHLFRYPRGVCVPVVVSDIQERSGVLGAAMMSFHRQLTTLQ